jgi:hypothetical protein
MRFRASKHPSPLGSEEHSEEEPSKGETKSVDPFWNALSVSVLLRCTVREERPSEECSSGEQSCQSPFRECIATTYPTIIWGKIDLDMKYKSEITFSLHEAKIE